MVGVADDLLIEGAQQLQGARRRMFLAKVCRALCDGSPRKTEARFGWGRATVTKGLAEVDSNRSNLPAVDSHRRGQLPSEEKNPQLKIDIRLVVAPHTHSDPELKTSRQYPNLSAEEVREALVEKGYAQNELPSERTIREILNRMNYGSSGFRKTRHGEC